MKTIKCCWKSLIMNALNCHHFLFKDQISNLSRRESCALWLPNKNPIYFVSITIHRQKASTKCHSIHFTATAPSEFKFHPLDPLEPLLRNMGSYYKGGFILVRPRLRHRPRTKVRTNRCTTCRSNTYGKTYDLSFDESDIEALIGWR